MSLFILKHSKTEPVHPFPGSMKEKMAGDWAFLYALDQEMFPQALLTESADAILYTNEKAVIRQADGSYSFCEKQMEAEELAARAQNNISAVSFKAGGQGFSFSAFSARINRSRIYFMVNEGCLLLADNVQQLLPFSTRQLRPEAGYSVLKYGESPEYITTIEDIFCVPVSHILHLNESRTAKIVNEGRLPADLFRPYYQLGFNKGGADIAGTEQVLDGVFAHIATQKPLVPVSGGIDSALINHMISRNSKAHYPAYHLKFGPGDKEVKYARMALHNTQADLDIVVMGKDDFIPAFEHQARKLQQPIGESSAMALAHYFMQTKYRGHSVVDGTLADGCYGSADYTRPLFAGYKAYPPFLLHLNEKLAAFLQSQCWPGQDRFHPRDSYQKDRYLQFMHMYLGPFANTWIKNAKTYTKQLAPSWDIYYQMLDDQARRDDWARYSIFKMANYACKNNTAKSFDNALPSNRVELPFTWLAVLEDQSRYSWAEKTKNGQIKYPLKKIAENYLPKEYIYRKKQGLNSSFERWMADRHIRRYLSTLAEKRGGVAEFYLGTKRRDRLVKMYNTRPLHNNMLRLMLNLALLQAWMDAHKIRI